MEHKTLTPSEQTVSQYAKISKIHLKQVLDDLKHSGFSCNADDVLSKNMRQELSKLFRQRLISEEAKAKVFALSAQTIGQYAKIYELPLKQTLDILKKSGFPCKADDVLNPEMHTKLAMRLCKRRIAEAEVQALTKAVAEAKALTKEKAKAEEIKARELAYVEEIKAIENEALAYAKVKATEVLDELRKIGQLIDLCFELLPEIQRVSIMGEMNNQIMSKVYVQSYYDYLKARFYENKNLDLYRTLGDSKFHRLQNEYNKIGRFFEIVKIPQWIIKDDCDIKSIKELKKQKRYTSALIKAISFIIRIDLLHYHRDIIYETSANRKLNFESFSFIGELFIDMGAINNALRLYDIDEGIFNNSNALSLLASNAIKIGTLESAIKLISKLIEKEPYHPSIPIMQSELKRLEQRDRLKSAFSIDFSKIDELSGIEFENLLMDKFAAMGFKVESTPKTGDFGADLIVENNEGTRIVVQCKRFKSKVNLKAVQEVIGAMGHYVGDFGVVITNNTFLNSAVKLAESHDIELWDGDKLVSFLADDLSFSEIIGIAE